MYDKYSAFMTNKNINNNTALVKFILFLKLIYKKIGKLMATLSPPPRMQFFDQNGDPLVGGKLYTYLSGTTTPTFTKTTALGDVNNTNPVILDARGEASIWLDETIVYRFVLKTSTDVTIWTGDGISGFLTPATKGQLRFTADGSFTVPTGVTKIWISGVAGGAGGSGGSRQLSSFGSFVYLGSGGGSGQASFKKSQTVTPGEVIPITIGLGGAGGAGGSSAPGSLGASGANGTDTIIGTYLTLVHGDGGGTASGGAGGSGGTFGALIDGQSGADGVGGDSSIIDGTVLNFYSGDGGSNMFGSGGRGRKLSIGTSPAPNGRAATGYGAGGSGGSYSTTVNANGGTGGAGANGVVLIEW
jgi:hypothetical protein